MEFLFLCSTQYRTSGCSEQVRYWALTLHNIRPGGNLMCKYSVVWLVQVQNGNITKCPSINYWKVQREKKKCIDEADNLKFLKSSNEMKCTISFSNQNLRVFYVNGNLPQSWTPEKKFHTLTQPCIILYISINELFIFLTCLFLMGKEFHRPADPVPRSWGSQYIWVQSTWWVF